MTFNMRITTLLLAAAVLGVPAGGVGRAVAGEKLERVAPVAVFADIEGITLGEPLGVAVDFDGNVIVADGSPGRLVKFNVTGTRAQEFDQPFGSPGFYPTDIALYGFFSYAIDERQRALVRFDKDGTFRGVLLNFDQLEGTRRVSPYGLGVDAQGRIAITDIENHQVLLIDSFLRLDILFGNYGSYAGQLDTPLGVSFTADGEIVVADTGNRRIQFYSDAGEPLSIVPTGEDPSPLRSPRRAVVDGEGVLYVADPTAGRVFVFDAEGRLVSELMPLDADQFQPTDVEIHRDGRLFVTDAMNRVLYVFKVM